MKTMNKKTYTTIDIYIDDFPKEIGKVLTEIRQQIRAAAPDAEETISYNMPAFRQQSVLVYFAACKNHIGFYPTPSAITAFKNELLGYKSSKGAVQFPINAVPLDLIRQIVEFRVEEIKQKSGD